VSRNGASVSPHNPPNPTPSRSRLQQANSHVTACQTKHVCSDAQACGRVAEIAGMVNIVGASVGAYLAKARFGNHGKRIFA